MKKLFFPLLFATTVLFTACDNNTTTDADNINDSIKEENRETATIDNRDQKFAEKAALGSMMEVEASKVALSQATNADVKAFAQQMIDDHTKAGQELNSIASSKNMTLPTMLNESQQKDLNDLREKTGADFDKKYVSMMVDDHKDDVDNFQDAVDNLDDGDLKTFAINTLPTLQKHKTKIEEINDRIK